MFKVNFEGWEVERLLPIIAGTVIILSVESAVFYTKLWLIITGIVGIGLIAFGLTGFCLLGSILAKCGIKSKYYKCDEEPKSSDCPNFSTCADCAE